MYQRTAGSPDGLPREANISLDGGKQRQHVIARARCASSGTSPATPSCGRLAEVISFSTSRRRICVDQHRTELGLGDGVRRASISLQAAASPVAERHRAAARSSNGLTTLPSEECLS